MSKPYDNAMVHMPDGSKLSISELIGQRAQLRDALRRVAEIIDAQPFCEPGKCRDCDLLREIRKAASVTEV